MYVENGGKSIIVRDYDKCRDAKQGGGKWGLNASQPPLILRGFFLIAHTLLCTGYFYMGGERGGGLAPIKLI